MVPAKKQTVEHVKEIVGEVENLHPILNVLFNRLPSITRVEYRQGPSEMGADFILHRFDEALIRTHHIGVVAKVGQIRQNTTDVERQIKECFVPRRGADSKAIEIREVWVVSTKEITQNARDVLAKLYADHKVEFIGGQELAALIDRHAPDAFVTTSPAMQDYASALLKRLDEDDRRSAIVPSLDKFYLEPAFTRVGFDGYGRKRTTKTVPSLQALLHEISRSQLSILLAGAGGGKSEAARQLARLVFESDDFSLGSRIPVLVHVRDIVDSSVLATVLQARERAGNQKLQVLLLVDGFDELDIDDGKRGDLIDAWLKDAAEDQAINIVVLSRPFDEAAVLRNRVQSADIFRIEPLRGTRAIRFIAKIAGEAAATSRLMTDLKESLLIRALEGAPIAYILLGRLVHENEQDLPSNLTELFQKYIEITLGRWEVSKGFRSQREYEVLTECLSWLAEYMLDSGLTEVSFSEVSQWMAVYCQDRGLEIDPDFLARRACERSSVLYRRGDGLAVGFRHRAFAEFFYASRLKRQGGLIARPDMYSPYWVNSYYFYVGLFKDCPGLLESFLKQEVKEDQDVWARVVHFGSFLLAAYLTPTRVASEAITKMAGDLSRMYVKACDPKSGSVFSELPTMQLLCLVTHSFTRSYGYKFFRLPLAEALLNVEAQERSEETAISLFLLSAAYKEAGGDLKFDALIENFGSNLPLVVKMAIGHEAERMKATSDVILKMERNLRRTFKGNSSASVYLKNLYDVPVARLEQKLLQ